MIPGFIYSYLRKLVHEDENNRIIYQNKDKSGLDFVDAALKDLNAEIIVNGLENIPDSGKQILISNHPLGGYDGLALMNTVGKVRKDLFFLANDILMFLPNLNPLFIPINKHGSNAENIKILNQSFDNDNVILIFPAGLVSRKINGEIKDPEWKNTFLTRSIRNNRDIIPVFVEGRNTEWFYNLANWRKKLGIKTNIEMFFLVDELYRQRSKAVTIHIGKPISYEFFDKKLKIDKWVEILRSYIYQLKENNNKDFYQYFSELNIN